MGAREEILEAIRRIDRDPFTVMDVLREMRGTRYAEGTIRTHITSRMCADAPDNHGTVYADLEHVGHGQYRVRR